MQNEWKVDICLDIYILLAEVGIVGVYEGVLEGLYQQGTISNQFLTINCTCKMDKMDICLDIYYLLSSLRLGL